MDPLRNTPSGYTAVEVEREGEPTTGDDIRQAR